MSLWHPLKEIRKEAVIRPSDNILHRNDAEKNTANDTPTKLKEIIISVSGKYRVKFDIKSGDGTQVKAQIYRNGSAYGTEQSTTSTDYVTKSEDLRFNAGDLVQLYVWCTTTGVGIVAYVKNLRLCGVPIRGIAYNTLS